MEVARISERPVHELIEEHARRAPDAVALCQHGEQLTYGELNEAANRLAWQLRGLGARRETPVAICLPRSARLLVAMVGVAKAGASGVLLSPDWPDRHLERVVTMSGPAGLIADEGGVPGMGPGTWHVAAAAPDLGMPSAPDPGLPPALDSIAYLVLTSGSTGEPKLVGVTHRALAHRALTHVNGYGIGPDDRSTWLTPPGSSISAAEIWPNLAAGASLHMPAPDVAASPAELRDWLVAQRITHAFIPMPSGEALFMLPWPVTCALRLITVGGDSVRRWPPHSLPPEVAVEYGSAEANGVCSGLATPGRCTSRTAGPVLRRARPPIGRPWQDIDALVLDGRLQPVPDGQPGELCVGSPELSRGYLGNAALTAERFVPHPWRAGQRVYRTGDIVRRDPDGLLHHHGRADAQEKILGHRIEPAEVEAVILEHPGIASAIVTGQTDPRGDRRLVGYLIERAPVDDGELRAFARSRLPAYMVPSVFVRLTEFPLTANHKVDRRGLPQPRWPEPGSQGPRRPGPEVAASCGPDPVLEDVLVVWSQLLGAASPETGFREAGGDSLHASRLLAQIQERFAVRIPLREFLREPTPARLARLIRAKRDSGDGARQLAS